MRIAYIGYDLSCTKADAFFSKQGDEVVYFLKEKGQNFNYKPFDQMGVLVDGLMISADEKKQTKQQNNKFKKINKKYFELRETLGCPSESLSESRKDSSKPNTVIDLYLFQDIQLDSKNKKIFIEVEKKGVETFDYLFIEAHPFLSTLLKEKNVHLFSKTLEKNYVWSSVNFEIDFLKPIEDFNFERIFLVILDSSRNSIIDNWFLCHFDNHQLNIWGFLPLHQVNNPGFKNFYIDRTRQWVSEKFKFIYLKNYLHSYLSTVGADEGFGSVRYHQTQCVPNFMFWSIEQVTNHFENKLLKKMKIIKKNLEAFS